MPAKAAKSSATTQLTLDPEALQAMLDQAVAAGAAVAAATNGSKSELKPGTARAFHSRKGSKYQYDGPIKFLDGSDGHVWLYFPRKAVKKGRLPKAKDGAIFLSFAPPRDTEDDES